MTSNITDKLARAEKVNELIKAIASHGRRFFTSRRRDGSTGLASVEVDQRGYVWWIDDYSGARIYTHWTRSSWPRFSHGGTLRDLVIVLRDFIRTGEPVRGHLGPWPEWYSGGDPWGYGAEAMEHVRAEAARLGIIKPIPTAGISRICLAVPA